MRRVAALVALVAFFARSHPERANRGSGRPAAGNPLRPSASAPPAAAPTPPITRLPPAGAPTGNASPAVSFVEELPSPVALPPADDSPGVVPTNDPFYENNLRYIFEVLRPRVRECWLTIEGDGEIEVRHDFIVEKGRAIAAPIGADTDDFVTVVSSTLPPGEDEKALDCLRRAAAGTSFAYVPLEPGGAIDGTYLTHYQHWASPARSRRLAQQAQGTDRSASPQ